MIHSYVLMDDHYHLVVEVPEANLSKGMRQLNGVYTQHVNRRHDQEGSNLSRSIQEWFYSKRKIIYCRSADTL